MLNNPIIIKVQNGLANRMLSIASAIKMSQILNRELKICWTIHQNHFVTNFEDLFQKMPFEFINECDLKNVKRLAGTEKWKFEYDYSEIPKETFYIEHNHSFFLKNSNRILKKELQYFLPILKIQEKIDKLLNSHNFKNMIGVHVRKGDKVKDDITGGRNNEILKFACADSHSNLVKKIDMKYIDVMKKIKSKNTNIKFFLSTDGDEEIYKNNFGNDIVTLDNKDTSRISGVPDAIIDMWLLSHTRQIISGVGTFALCASLISGIQNINIFSSNERSLSFPDGFCYYGKIN